MKKVIAYFIKFPVAVNVIILAFIIFGIAGAMSLKSSFFPLVESRNLMIQVIYPGASPQEMEEGIVLKIENNLKGLVGIERVTSVSRENSATINVETEKGKDIDFVLADVKNAVDRVPSFPSGMEPPIVAKIETIRPTISFSISGERVSLKTLKEQARKIENDIRNIDGISQVKVTGFPDEEIEIALREKDLRAYDLSFQEVAQAVRASNLLITGGNIKTNAEDYLIRARSRKYFANELLHIVVRKDPSGHIIRLNDVAKVRDIWNENPDRLYFNGQPAIDLTISNTNNEDLLSSAEKIKEYIKNYNEANTNIQLSISSDRSLPLNQRTLLLMKNAAMGIFLVLFFLSLFLNIRMALWVSVGLPISFLGMFIFASQMNVTINVLSLFGMIIVIGILVDDAIVVGENIYYHYEKGKSPIKAAIDGTMEVLSPVVSAIITTLVAFSALYFIDGRMGDFFSQVATIVSLTLAVSLFEALIILPSHIAHSKALETKEEAKKEKGLLRFFNKINEKSDAGLVWVRDRLFAPYLRFFLKNRLLGFAIPLTLLILTIGALKGGVVGTTFFPNIASDRISVNLAMPQGTNERITDSIISSIEEKVWVVDEEYTVKQSGGYQVVENVIKRIGPGTSNASLSINLLPGDKRDFSAIEINSSLREKVGRVDGVESLSFGSGGNFGGMPVSISLLGENIDELKRAKAYLKDEMSKNSQIKDITDNDPAGIKEIQVELKESAYQLGLTLQSVMNQVRYAIFGYQAQRYQRGQDEIKIWVRYDRKDRSAIKNLDEMRILTPMGTRVPFSEIATYSIARGEVSINHLNTRREIQVNADLKSPDDSASDIVEGIKTDIMPGLHARFPSVSAIYEGQNREAEKVQRSAPRVVLIMLALIYIIIAFTFRSYAQPFLLMFLIPFSLIGVVWGHYLHDFKVNILSSMGIIALVGIMVNDGLVLIGKFNTYLKEGEKFDDALLHAGISRFRPILLTSVTTFAGLMPLLLERSRQAQFLKPMAISISYGIVIATFLTLLLLPLLLSFWNSVRVFMKWLITGEKVSRESIERVIIEKKAAEADI